MNPNVKFCPICLGELVELESLNKQPDTYQCMSCNHAFEIKEDKS